MRELRSEVHEWLRARIATAPKPVNELREPVPTRIGRVSMNESPCADHATAHAKRNRGCKSGPDIHLFSDLKESIGTSSE